MALPQGYDARLGRAFLQHGWYFLKVITLQRRHKSPMPVLALASMCLVLAATSAFALDPRNSITQYVYDLWQTKQGLPHPYVRCLAQTQDGYIWLGTPVGLVRFDGIRFTLFDHSNTPELSLDHVTALRAVSDGSLWIGTFGGGLVRMKDGSFHRFEAEVPRYIWSIFEGRDHTIWVATGVGLKRYAKGKWSTFSENEGLPHINLRSVLEDREGNIWVGTLSAGLSVLRNGRFSTVPGTSQHGFRTMFEDRQGTLWLAVEGGGLMTIRNGLLDRHPLYGLGSDTVRAFFQDSHGNLWIATDTSGLLRITSQGDFSRFSKKDGFCDDAVWAIQEDHEGNLWAGTRSGGLAKFTQGKFTTYTSREGLASDEVWTILEGRDGTTWMGTAGGGLVRYKDGKFSFITRAHGLTDNYIRSLFESRDGSLWIGTANGGLNRLRNGKITSYDSRQGLGYRIIRAISEEPDGTIWVGAENGGLHRMRNGRFEEVSIGLHKPSIWALAHDRSGRLWIAAYGQGLFRYENGRIGYCTPSEGLTHGIIWSIYEDRAGDLWIASGGGGLFHYHNGQFMQYGVKEGLPSNYIAQVIEDETGDLWVSCEKGLFRIRREDLGAFEEGQSVKLAVTTYDMSDGLKSIEFSSGNQPAGWKTRSGRLWFPTTRGAVAVDPDRIRSNSKAPKVDIERLFVGRQLVPLEKKVLLQPRSRDIELSYTGLSFQEPARVRFRYKLEGFDSDWVDAGTRRTAHYSELPPGSFRFHVIASNNDAVWNESGATLDLEQAPTLYQMSWFRALCVAALLIGIWGIHRLRVRQLCREFTAVVAERGRIAREMHDTIIQGCIGVSTLLEATSSVIVNSPSSGHSLLNQARAHLRKCLDEARYSVLNLRNPDLMSGLFACMSRMASEMATRYGVQIRFSASSTERALDGQQEYHLLRIAQEALLNAIRHGRAQLVDIHLDYGPPNVKLTIRDDGAGFEPEQQDTADYGHFGLLGMQERARQIGAELSVTSSPGRGAEIEVMVREE